MHLEAVRSRIQDAAKRAGRDPGSITIVAVTKTHPVSAVQEALAAGLPDVGENRVQEALGKQEEWKGPPVRWHLIGHLQRNKAKQAAGRFALIHSLDSIRLADALEQAAAQAGVTQDVLIQVNVAREEQKDGVSPEDAEALVRHAETLPHLKVKGWMTMAPFTNDVGVQRATFSGLREMSLRLPIAHCPLPVLSMGMSGDFEVAVEEGATLLRLGTILFGERKP